MNRMKKSWRKTSLTALLLTLALGTGGAAYAQSADEQPASESKAVETVPATPVHKMITIRSLPAAGLLANPVHEQQYIKLLVKAYMPEQEQEWTEAFNERKALDLKLMKPVVFTSKAQASGEAGSVEVPDSAPMESIQAVLAQTLTVTPAQASEAVSSTEAKEEAEPVPVKKIIMPKDPVEAHAIIQGDMMALQAQFKLQDELAHAVEADDAVQMKVLLPQLLDEYKAGTVQLKSMIKLTSAEAAPITEDKQAQ